MKWENANDKPEQSGVYYCRVTEGESAYTAVIEFSMGFWCVDNEFIDVVEWLDESTESFDEDDRDEFALSFLAWHNHHPQAQMYHNAGASTYELLQKYKSRPYIDNNPENQ